MNSPCRLSNESQGWVVLRGLSGSPAPRAETVMGEQDRLEGVLIVSQRLRQPLVFDHLRTDPLPTDADVVKATRHCPDTPRLHIRTRLLSLGKRDQIPRPATAEPKRLADVVDPPAIPPEAGG